MKPLTPEERATLADPDRRDYTRRLARECLDGAEAAGIVMPTMAMFLSRAVLAYCPPGEATAAPCARIDLDADGNYEVSVQFDHPGDRSEVGIIRIDNLATMRALALYLLAESDRLDAGKET